MADSTNSNTSGNGPIYHTTGDILSNNASWKRYYRIIIYSRTQQAIVYPNSDGSNQDAVRKSSQQQDGKKVLDVSDLRCSFTVKRYAQQNPSTATVTIYNFSATSETMIMEEGYRITIEAGYQGYHGKIFDGDILMCSRQKQNGTDYLLTILAMDGAQFYQFGYANFAVDRGATARDVVENIKNKAAVGISLGYASPALDTIKFSRGYAAHGLARDTLDNIAKTINGTWFISDGQLYILKYSDDVSQLPMGKQAVELSPATGLIGNPTQVEQGINAQCLLNPTIVPYCLVNIKNEFITRQLPDIGSYSQAISTVWDLDPQCLYRVISVIHQGDTRDNSWYSFVNAITQNGNIPETLMNSSHTLN